MSLPGTNQLSDVERQTKGKTAEVIGHAACVSHLNMPELARFEADPCVEPVLSCKSCSYGNGCKLERPVRIPRASLVVTRSVGAIASITVVAFAFTVVATVALTVAVVALTGVTVVALASITTLTLTALIGQNHLAKDRLAS